MGALEQDLNALEACASIEEIRAVFQRIIEDYGFSTFGFMDASHPWEDQPLLVSTHAPAWIDTYRSENFINTDPCLAMARRTNLPFHWGSVRLPPVTGKRKPGAVKTMEAARDFGVKEGLTIPVHYNDPLGRRYSSVCALFWNNPVEGFFANLRHNGLQLHVILLYLAQKIVDLHAIEIKTSTRTDHFAAVQLCALTDREKEVLKWAGMGKTSDETAVILSVSRKTVEAHVKGAMIKLGATNKTQATVQAVYRGLIDI
ncbi:autoinducer binding domain-containing protein [Bradyrhizobium sp. UFLA05-112]